MTTDRESKLLNDDNKGWICPFSLFIPVLHQVEKKSRSLYSSQGHYNRRVASLRPFNLQVAIKRRIELKSPKHIQNNPWLLDLVTCTGRIGALNNAGIFKAPYCHVCSTPQYPNDDCRLYIRAWNEITMWLQLAVTRLSPRGGGRWVVGDGKSGTGTS